MITKEPGNSGKVRVNFLLPAAIWADTIHLVGDFNHWNNTATPLRLGDVTWSVTLELDAGQSYHYRYLVNGQEWMNDWHADGNVSVGYGIDNSVVMAQLPDEMPSVVINLPAPAPRPMLRVIAGRQDERRVG